MRRAVARGRILPQSLSTDPRYGRLSLKAQVLYPLLWINADDQGRLSGDPDEIKYAACPSISEITADEIPTLLQQMETRSLIKVYTTSRTKAVQMLDWWEVQKLQWAYPSGYPPPEGWQDRLRYHASPTEIVTENWPAKSPNSLPKELPSALGSALGSKAPQQPYGDLAEEIRAELIGLPYSESKILEHERAKEKLAELGIRKGYISQEEVEVDQGRIDLCWGNERGEVIAAFEIETLNPKGKSLAKLQNIQCQHRFIILRTNALPFQRVGDLILIGLNRKKISRVELHPTPPNEKEKEGGNRRGRGNLPSALGSTSPSPAATDTLNKLKQVYPYAFGKEPGARISAQLRDLADELSAARCPLEYIDEAFSQAAGQNKFSVSYVRAILLDWLAVPRAPPYYY